MYRDTIWEVNMEYMPSGNSTCVFNSPLSICLLPPCNSSGETIHMKISSACRFVFMQIKLIFVLRLVLKQRHKRTRKFLIGNYLLYRFYNWRYLKYLYTFLSFT